MICFGVFFRVRVWVRVWVRVKVWTWNQGIRAVKLNSLASDLVKALFNLSLPRLEPTQLLITHFFNFSSWPGLPPYPTQRYQSRSQPNNPPLRWSVIPLLISVTPVSRTYLLLALPVQRSVMRTHTSILLLVPYHRGWKCYKVNWNTYIIRLYT